MLVLSRKRSERILIGSDIRITIVRIEGSHVRVGIEAPDNLMILRAELLERGTAEVANEQPSTQPSGLPEG
ncbi:carbon storage regulator [Singulisphaera rosea]